MSSIKLGYIISRLKRLRPVSDMDMVAQMQLLVKPGLLKTTRDHNTKSVKIVFKTSDGLFFLKAEYGANNKVSREVSWYKACQEDMPVPKLVASYSGDEYAFILLDYLNEAQTLADITETNSHDKTWQYLESILDKNEELFAKHTTTSVGNNGVTQFFIHKYQGRRAEAKKYSFLRDLIEQPVIVVNGLQLRNIDFFFNRLFLDSKLQDYLMPTTTGFIHGDLHFDNILVSNEYVYVVDPNGKMALPLEYDLGKVLHSIHGGYNSIMRENFNVLKLEEGVYQFELKMNSVYEEFLSKIKDKYTEQKILRGLCFEAMHFATLLPHHAENTEESIALFLRTLQLFEELFGSLDIK